MGVHVDDRKEETTGPSETEKFAFLAATEVVLEDRHSGGGKDGLEEILELPGGALFKW